MIQADFHLDLKGFTLNGKLNDGGLVLLSGENGSGKSTFLKSLAGLIPIHSGKILINDVDVTYLEPQKRRVVYATQNSYFSHFTVERHVLWAMGEDASRETMRELFEAFGINFGGKLKDLSMGQRMRVTLATAFASRPRAILLDEVISNISNPESVLEVIGRLAARKSVDVIFVAHSLGGKTASHHYNMEAGSMKKVF